MEGQLDSEKIAFSPTNCIPRDNKGDMLDGELCYRVEYGAWEVNDSLILDIVNEQIKSILAMMQ